MVVRSGQVLGERSGGRGNRRGAFDAFERRISERRGRSRIKRMVMMVMVMTTHVLAYEEEEVGSVHTDDDDGNVFLLSWRDHQPG